MLLYLEDGILFNTNGARKGSKEHGLRLKVMVLITRDDKNGQVEKLKLLLNKTSGSWLKARIGSR